MYNFEEWLSRNKNSLCDEAQFLFSDSLKCIKNDIDRPAYLLAYQGMMVYIRDVLHRGSAPSGFTEEEWTNRLKNTTNEDSWDSAVFDLIKQDISVDRHKAAPLCMSKNVRMQFDYWRSLRNTCAHYKKEPFSKAHVIALYSFIEYYLLNISVSGGLQDMLSELKNYCDPTKTPDDKPLQPLIDRTLERLTDTEYDDYIKDGIKIVVQSSRKKVVDFVEHILSLSGAKYEVLKEKLVSFISNKENLMHRLIEREPSRLSLFCKTDERKREFWKEDIFQLNRNRVAVVAYMLNAGFIPQTEKAEFFNSILSNCYRYDSRITFIKDEDHNAFVDNGYYDCFVSKYLVPNHFCVHPYLGELCYKTNFIISHILNMPLYKKSVDALIEVLGSNRARPYTVESRFYSEVLTDKVFRDKLTTAASESRIELPDDWLKTTIKR